MIKIGIGPSSSHTMGPWKAAQICLRSLTEQKKLLSVVRVTIDFFGSLAKTGTGHGTNMAAVMGLSGEDYLTTDTSTIRERYKAIKDSGRLHLAGQQSIPFEIVLHPDPLPFHPNGMRFTFFFNEGAPFRDTFYSVGGGFVVREGETVIDHRTPLPFPIHRATDLLNYSRQHQAKISEIVLRNELAWSDAEEINRRLEELWATIQNCVYRGCHTDGILPGGLNVKRRAAELNRRLLGNIRPDSQETWLKTLANIQPSFQTILKWVSCFALAANEENAAFGRVVTAPTNGACGVIPAVLFYYRYFCENADEQGIKNFLLVAGEIGSIFKKGATISAALGGCQAEIGVSSAMAAAALTECLGGTPEQALMAAEIAMEHHLGLTCDPIGGLVQIPCIERNSMGAIKAITAANLALESNPDDAKVSLDTVIQSMWDTAQNMSNRYKETAEGGLALHIPVNVTEC
jgi:L-serine dehydratase